VVAAGLWAWQWYAPVREIGKGAGDPSTQAAYYTGVAGYLKDQAERGGAPLRVEVPFTQGHWEAVHLARHVPLARGWATQLDRRYNPLFFEGTLDPDAYGRWLRRNAVGWVAVPDAALDPAGRQEAAIIRRGLPFLEPVWADEHWQVLRVRDPLPLVSGSGELVSFGPRGFTVRADGPGWILVRTHHTPYWRTRGAPACVSEAPGGWTRVYALAAGRITVDARFAPGRLAARGPVCERDRGTATA
jgi:hypothetical protein